MNANHLIDLFLQALASSAGVTVLAALLAWVLNRVFLAKPEWKVVYDAYRPAFISAVKYAEKLMPDGASRLAAALKRVIEIDAALNGVSESVLRQVLTVVHAEAEAAGNI
jgi:hypothetical protein